MLVKVVQWVSLAPTHERAVANQLSPALMLHGGGHVLHTRRHINLRHVAQLLDLGILPVSVDYRLCPEVNLREGPMTDACEAVQWAREVLPFLLAHLRGISIDPKRVVVIGYSTGGHLALTTAFTTLEKGLRPPTAVIGFYCPTDYSSDWWRSPIYPQLAQQPSSTDFDLLEGVHDTPVSTELYGPRSLTYADMSLRRSPAIVLP